VAEYEDISQNATANEQRYDDAQSMVTEMATTTTTIYAVTHLIY